MTIKTEIKRHHAYSTLGRILGVVFLIASVGAAAEDLSRFNELPAFELTFPLMHVNRAYIQQEGTKNIVNIKQHVYAEEEQATQSGEANQRRLAQGEIYNTAIFEQSGHANTAALLQSGNRHIVATVQWGEENAISISQYASAGYARVTQYGKGNSASVEQHIIGAHTSFTHLDHGARVTSSR